MFLPFEKLPDTSRVWVYASERPLSQNELAALSDKLQHFTSNWQSHQKDVVSSFKVIDDLFVVIASDDSSDVSGCGIDKSVHVMQELEKELSLSFMDKTIVYLKTDTGIKKATLKELRSMVESNVLTPETLFYNTLVSNIKQLKEQFEIPAREGWLKKYFSLVTPS